MAKRGVTPVGTCLEQPTRLNVAIRGTTPTLLELTQPNSKYVDPLECVAQFSIPAPVRRNTQRIWDSSFAGGDASAMCVRMGQFRRRFNSALEAQTRVASRG